MIPERVGRPIIVFVGAVLAVFLLASAGCDDSLADRIRACGMMCGGRASSYRVSTTYERGYGVVETPICLCGGGAQDAGVRD